MTFDNSHLSTKNVINRKNQVTLTMNLLVEMDGFRVESIGLINTVKV